ncbi:hypothetical protein NLJ89_g11856 [Agrocybe chaxingu]|uniref:Sugar phosphate phosphatase n=1 Tax=Agrocybe chaxingu TaxID=84603 RepID=A0A9W8JNK6_9AGAR|nr:hypothetical protein NLJ89_g11856 [Agrocybe chaxingu]
MTEDQIKALQSTGGSTSSEITSIACGTMSRCFVRRPAAEWTASGDFIWFAFDLTNFVLADFLIQSGLANQIRFHGKRYPWFVSDVTKKDWEVR